MVVEQPSTVFSTFARGLSAFFTLPTTAAAQSQDDLENLASDDSGDGSPVFNPNVLSTEKIGALRITLADCVF